MTNIDDTLKRAHAAVEALAAIGAGQSSEHLHALDGCRALLAERDREVAELRAELDALRIQAADSESRYRRVEARIRTEGFAVIDAEGCIRAIDTMTQK